MALPWCVLLSPKLPGKPKAAELLAAKWTPGRIITISFLDDDCGLRDRVRTVAEQWLSQTGANLSFQWRRDTTATDIRISFKLAGSWSVLGTYALAEEDPAKPTMNFGWLRAGATDLDLQEVVLHEFGHALGLIHEHQSPESTIPWDRDAVIRDLSGPPNFWTVAQIEYNVLTGYDRSEVRTTPFDCRSIMLYPVNKAWTIGGYETPRNTDLSESDIRLVRELYGLR